MECTALLSENMSCIHKLFSDSSYILREQMAAHDEDETRCAHLGVCIRVYDTSGRVEVAS